MDYNRLPRFLWLILGSHLVLTLNIAAAPPPSTREALPDEQRAANLERIIGLQHGFHRMSNDDQTIVRGMVSDSVGYEPVILSAHHSAMAEGDFDRAIRIAAVMQLLDKPS